MAITRKSPDNYQNINVFKKTYKSMVTSEKLTWLKQNLKRGERTAISNNTGVEYSVVIDIIKGKLWGEHGGTVIDAAEKMIISRQKREERERKKFAKTNAL